MPQQPPPAAPTDGASPEPTTAPAAQRPPPGEAAKEPELFRREALAAQASQWLGTVLLAPRLSHRLFAVFGASAALAIVALLAFGDYTRKARVSGWLVPETGVVQVYAPRPAVVTQVHVKEGSVVRRGEPLVTLSQELSSSALGATQSEIGRRLGERAESLRGEAEQQQRLMAQQQQSLSGRLQALRSEELKFDEEIALLTARTGIAEQAMALQRKLVVEGFVSEPRYQQAEADLLELRARMRALERSRSTISRERLVAEGELRDLPLKLERERSLIARTLSQVEQERAESEALREIVIAAPHDGIVTAILAVQGGQASTAAPMLSLVPQGATLLAHLYAPSRSVGFVRPGQRVLLRYEAYPYQRFGHHEGTLLSVSRSAVGASELPPHLAGLLAGSGSAEGGGAAAAEPVYRLTVALAAQTVKAYGQPLPLQAGTVLEADVSLETRRLYEWVLDPLFTLTGKWQG